MPRTRDWLKHDAWFLADDKIRRLGHTFGAQGPLVAEALLELAKRQKTGGDVEISWSYLVEHAFVAGRGVAARRKARAIVELCAELEFAEIFEIDDEGVRLTLPKWRRIQGAGVPGGERTAKWRARKTGASDEDVTSQNGGRDVTVTELSRAHAEEVREREEAKASSSGADRAEKEMGKASEEDRANCRLFAELVRQHNPKAKLPKAGTSAQAEWYQQMRLLRTADNNAGEEIAAVIRWVFTDPSKDAMFWGTTIQAPSGLRSHYAQIHAKMTAAHRSGNGNGAGVESSAAFLARRGAS